MSEALRESARIALMECLNLGRQEMLLVVCDPPCAEIGWMLWNVGSKRCREAVLVQISPRKQNGNEPPQPVGEWFGKFDVAVMPTSNRFRIRRRVERRASRARASRRCRE